MPGAPFVFPEGFVWGVSAAAPPAPEAAGALADLGVGTCAFPVGWAAAAPEKPHAYDDAALDRCARAAHALRERGLAPAPMLFDGSLPAALEAAGGWMHPDTPRWFGEYAHRIARRLEGAAGLWVGIDAPDEAIERAYRAAAAAMPPRRVSAAVLAHHLLLGQALAAEAVRSESEAPIGAAFCADPLEPATDAADDLRATERLASWRYGLYLGALLHGRYPEDLEEWFPGAAPEMPEGAGAYLGAGLGLIGWRAGGAAAVAARPGAHPAPAHARHRLPLEGRLAEGLSRFGEAYPGAPLYILSGAHPPDSESLLVGRLQAVWEAIRRGAPVAGWLALPSAAALGAAAGKLGAVYREIIETRGEALNR